MTSVSAGHIILTPTKPVGIGTLYQNKISYSTPCLSKSVLTISEALRSLLMVDWAGKKNLQSTSQLEVSDKTPMLLDCLSFSLQDSPHNGEKKRCNIFCVEIQEFSPVENKIISTQSYYYKSIIN